MGEVLEGLLLVEWDDSSTFTEEPWIDLSELRRIAGDGPLPCRSTGFLVHEDDYSLTLAQSWSPDSDGEPARAGQPLQIPKAVVRRRIVLAPVYTEERAGTREAVDVEGFETKGRRF